MDNKHHAVILYIVHLEFLKCETLETGPFCYHI